MSLRTRTRPLVKVTGAVEEMAQARKMAEASTQHAEQVIREIDARAGSRAPDPANTPNLSSFTPNAQKPKPWGWKPAAKTAALATGAAATGGVITYTAIKSLPPPSSPGTGADGMPDDNGANPDGKPDGKSPLAAGLWGAAIGGIAGLLVGLGISEEAAEGIANLVLLALIVLLIVLIMRK